MANGGSGSERSWCARGCEQTVVAKAAVTQGTTGAGRCRGCSATAQAETGRGSNGAGGGSGHG